MRLNCKLFQPVLTGILAACAVLAGCARLELPQERALLRRAASASPPTSLDNSWNAWRGGQRHGQSDEEALPSRWTAQEGIRWRAALPGEGNSSPIVWRDGVFLTCELPADDGVELAVVCLSREDGSLLWQRELGPPDGSTHRKNGYASATPATDGQLVYAYFGGRGMFAFDMRGHRVWHTELNAPAHQWGTASSPLLYGELVIQLCDGGGDSFLVGLHKRTGQVVWRTERPSRGCWSSPVLAPVAAEAADASEAGAVELVVNGTATPDGSAGLVLAYDPSSGRQLWSLRGTADIPCPTAIVGEGLVVSTSGGNGPILAMRGGGRGDVTDEHVVWRRPTGGAYVPTGIIYRGRLFLITDGGIASCHRLEDGEVIWRQRLRGTFAASLVAGDGKIYACSEQGEVYVLAAGDSYELLSTNRMGEPLLATPALAGGELFLRSSKALYCIAAANSEMASDGDVSSAAAQELVDEMQRPRAQPLGERAATETEAAGG